MKLQGTFVFLILITCQSTIMAQSNIKLLSIVDPMCSWCYGFSPELTKALEELDEDISVQLVMGGLRPYNTETMAELGDFLKEHWQQVQSRSGQPFRFELLEEKNFVYDTEPAARAVVVMRRLKPEAEFDFYKAVQSAFYAENKHTNKIDTYVPLAAKYGVDPDTFKEAFESDAAKKAVRADFDYATSIGVQGFPTLALQIGEELHVIAYGYTAAEDIMKRIHTVLAKEKAGH